MEFFKKLALGALMVGVLVVVEFSGWDGAVGGFKFIQSAEARVGRPLTPISGAGVARRTTRRVIRRGAYVAALPGGCAYYAPYYNCGGVYYQPEVQGGNTVYVTVVLED
ncbi:MAG: hypothetical protein IPM97_12870 [Bdellovibrionaceae bacterium]|nr:hypothetical protein [Pseudobdellovibrionaceae bacterium]